MIANANKQEKQNKHTFREEREITVIIYRQSHLLKNLRESTKKHLSVASFSQL